MAQQGKTLFFINGPFPSDAEKAAADKAGITRFRNARLVGEDEKPEDCVAVAGAVPKSYREAKGIKVLDIKVEKDAPAQSGDGEGKGEGAAKPGTQADKPAASK